MDMDEIAGLLKAQRLPAENISAEVLEALPFEPHDPDSVIEIHNPEFTSLCPKTGLPDFGSISIRYIPFRHIVELKSLKYYFMQFRCTGIFYEQLTRLIRELQVDIFVTNQLPRNYQKLGIDYETLKKIKADIIWLGVTGFGPESNEAAYDPILQARSGLMDLTGKSDGDPQVIGIPLPDMGTSEHAYGLLMKALYQRALSGKGTRIDLAMFESSVSWLTVPITMTASFDKRITRRGNTHEFFSPVSVYRTSDGFIYLAVGNDRQWQSLTGLDPFKSLDTPVYRQNKGRIDYVAVLKRKINSSTGNYTSVALIDMLTSITVPVSDLKPV